MKKMGAKTSRRIIVANIECIKEVYCTCDFYKEFSWQNEMFVIKNNGDETLNTLLLKFN